MNPENDEIEIDLKEIFFLLKRKIYIILLVTVLTATAAALYSNFIINPKYSSTSKIFILTKSTSITTFADIQLGSSLTKDYMELIKSRPVVDKVAENLGLDLEYEELLEKVTISNPADTRILNLTVEDTNPHIAKEIADEFAVVASERISSIMETDEPNIVENGHVAENPISPSVKKNTLIGGLAGAFLTVLIILALYILDDTIKTSDDIEKYLGINTLAEIPLGKGQKKNKRKDMRARK
jgi:capsular polysaccharide biosynthesis protein